MIEAKEPVKILLIEDSPEYRRVIDLAFQRDKQLDLILSTGTAERALEVLGRIQHDLERPDLILLDLNLPGMGGLAAIPRLLTTSPSSKILVISQSDKEVDVVAAISAGASGYLLKSSEIPHVKESIQIVMAGGAALDAKVAQFILKTFREKKPARQEGLEISGRELEILQLLAEGLVKKQIAVQLQISPFTVAAHVRNIYTKLQVVNAPAAVTQAFRKGLLPL
jgi:DNA-binding NarL/FixJ family response regulator